MPLVVSYDKNERVYNAPMPLLFQWRRRLENRPVTETSLRGYLDQAVGLQNPGAACELLFCGPGDRLRRSSGGVAVFVDQPAEDACVTDGGPRDRGGHGGRVGWVLAEGSVRPVGIDMLRVAVED